MLYVIIIIIIIIIITSLTDTYKPTHTQHKTLPFLLHNLLQLNSVCTKC